MVCARDHRYACVLWPGSTTKMDNYTLFFTRILAVVCGGFPAFLWFHCLSSQMPTCGDLWWFAVVCGHLRWFAVVCGGLSFSCTRQEVHFYIRCHENGSRRIFMQKLIFLLYRIDLRSTCRKMMRTRVHIFRPLDPPLGGGSFPLTDSVGLDQPMNDGNRK